MDTPATPVAQPTATPGTVEPGQTPPSTPPANPAQPGGQVTIPTEEYARLQRNDARLRAAQRRTTPAPRGTRPTGAAPDPTADPDAIVAEEVQRERQARQELEQQIFQRDVKDFTRDLLAKPEYANLPESTKRLILRNPASYSEAHDLENAKLDIEDFLREELAANPPSNGQQPGQQPAPRKAADPQGHETPPHNATGAPAAAPNDQLEDLSTLSGPARSKAAFRNAMKKKQGIGG